MKIRKLLTIPGLVALGAIPTMMMTSCNDTPTSINDQAKQYIFDRTFSIVSVVQTGAQTAGTVWGTAWVLADSTPDITNDYKYFIATNWHVIKGQEDLIEKAYQEGKYALRYGCNESDSGMPLTSTVKFASFTKIAQANFTYDNSTTITTTETTESGTATKTGLKGCDVYIVEADFDNFASQGDRASAPIAKAKLDRLNKLTAAGKKITELAPTTTDSSHWENKKLFTGGYPYKAAVEGSKWEIHDLSQKQGTRGETVSLTYISQTSVEEDKYTHWADNHDSPMIDCSPQYAYTGTGYFEDWMTGGASGSMLIGNFGTDTEPVFKVVGIYWGGQGYKSGDHQYIQPYFSIFNSGWKNYLEDWA